MTEPIRATETVLCRRDGRVGRIGLDRPGALNALDLGMVRAIRRALAAWREDARVHAVVIEGHGGRAFCAGGDVRQARAQVLAGEWERVYEFFAAEYAMNREIAAYPKPVVALVDGICMGGGIGVSVHGEARVASERAVFAMPETAIALFPDIGATFLLPRLPGALGTWLALTGARLVGADAVHAGLATHFVPSAGFPALAAALARDGLAALAPAATPLPPAGFAAERAAIDRCFGRASVADILAALAAEGTAWAEETLATLRRMSPASVLWSFAMLRRGAERSLGQCLDAELELVMKVTRHPDFAEGVRAMVVDKDRTPRWRDAAIEAVDPAEIAAMVG